METINIFSNAIQNFDVYSWVVLPLLIFLARVVDVTLGTIRIIMVNRGKRNIAPILGFVEVFIWIVAIGQLVQHLQSFTSFIGYAAGFAAGNYVGMIIEDKLALGYVIIRVILSNKGDELIHNLTQAGFGVTSFDGQGGNGPVKLIFTTVRRKETQLVFDLIHQINPKAFITVEDTRKVEAGIFHPSVHMMGPISPLRKSK